MGITRLQLYNDALRLCGERSLASLSEDREPRRLLDEVWNGHGVDYCLSQGQWYFAMRAVMIDPDSGITPGFGPSNAFAKPTDWVATSALCSDEYFRSPLTQYVDETGYWYADITPLYVKFVSNGATYGGDLTKWPAAFCDYAAAYFASQILGKLGGDKSAQSVFLLGPPGYPTRGYLAHSLRVAKNTAAMTQPTQFAAQGNWTRARLGSRRGYNDRGNTGSLIG